MRPCECVAGIPSSGRVLGLCMRSVWLEILRRKDVYVLLILALLLAGGSLVIMLVGIENASTATMLLNLGLTFGSLCAHLLTLMTAARQIPEERETRQLLPLLAKPIDRGVYLTGKWLASWACGSVALFVLCAMVYAVIPRQQEFSGRLLAQAVALQVVSLGVLAAWALALSLVLPKALNLALVAFVYLGGATVIRFLRARALDTPVHSWVEWITGYLPNFSHWNLITRYTDGAAALSGLECGGLMASGLVMAALPLVVAAHVFRRQTLA